MNITEALSRFCDENIDNMEIKSKHVEICSNSIFPEITFYLSKI